MAGTLRLVVQPADSLADQARRSHSWIVQRAFMACPTSHAIEEHCPAHFLRAVSNPSTRIDWHPHDAVPHGHYRPPLNALLPLHDDCNLPTVKVGCHSHNHKLKVRTRTHCPALATLSHPAQWALLALSVDLINQQRLSHLVEGREEFLIHDDRFFDRCSRAAGEIVPHPGVCR